MASSPRAPRRRPGAPCAAPAGRSARRGQRRRRPTDRREQRLPRDPVARQQRRGDGPVRRRSARTSTASAAGSDSRPSPGGGRPHPRRRDPLRVLPEQQLAAPAPRRCPAADRPADRVAAQRARRPCPRATASEVPYRSSGTDVRGAEHARRPGLGRSGRRCRAQRGCQQPGDRAVRASTVAVPERGEQQLHALDPQAGRAARREGAVVRVGQSRRGQGLPLLGRRAAERAPRRAARRGRPAPRRPSRAARRRGGRPPGRRRRARPRAADDARWHSASTRAVAAASSATSSSRAACRGGGPPRRPRGPRRWRPPREPAARIAAPRSGRPASRPQAAAKSSSCSARSAATRPRASSSRSRVRRQPAAAPRTAPASVAREGRRRRRPAPRRPSASSPSQPRRGGGRAGQVASSTARQKAAPATPRTRSSSAAGIARRQVERERFRQRDGHRRARPSGRRRAAPRRARATSRRRRPPWRPASASSPASARPADPVAVEERLDRRLQGTADVAGVPASRARDVLGGPGRPRAACRPARTPPRPASRWTWPAVCGRRAGRRAGVVHRPGGGTRRATRSGVHNVHRLCPQAVDNVAAYAARRATRDGGRTASGARRCRSSWSAGWSPR